MVRELTRYYIDSIEFDQPAYFRSSRLYASWRGMQRVYHRTSTARAKYLFQVLELFDSWGYDEEDGYFYAQNSSDGGARTIFNLHPNLPRMTPRGLIDLVNKNPRRFVGATSMKLYTTYWNFLRTAEERERN